MKYKLIHIDWQKLALVACCMRYLHYCKKRLASRRRKTYSEVVFGFKEIFRNREEKGEFQHLLQELRLHDREYY